MQKMANLPELRFVMEGPVHLLWIRYVWAIFDQGEKEGAKAGCLLFYLLVIAGNSLGIHKRHIHSFVYQCSAKVRMQERAGKVNYI